MFDSFLSEYDITTESPELMPKYTYAIVEPLLEPDLMQVVYQKGVADLRHARLFADTEYRDLADKGPIIVQLSPQNDSFTVLKRRLEEKPSGCFIQRTQPFEFVFDWARQRLTIQTGQAKALLRYYEPRMLLPLLCGLNQDEKASFVSGISSIHWFHHTWMALNARGISDQSIEPTAGYSGFVLSSE
ncbi:MULTISPECIES: DUF4123 domain-containing protein [Marinomonas]|uniref:DUF4123 domain-containing protein n=1 Tax=Marinomonas arctica TaxID=383750 RepID=A0A7H1J8Y6_9GAMM|nr:MULTISPECIES: DUF4123 domain-containing protein [Marinomonas]MCS7488699.1 hypothetical protein [Marinomonas sp. BSi20414]QNT06952.1 DUF4123 domain-containing protein [Marinomonas arctica]GGN34289.1 hypothetical protein GCM10011350_30500 [Marinomonas arctica]GGN39542.1 hypothetical protein GCM10011350_40450 [Marinomonas arctica]